MATSQCPISHPNKCQSSSDVNQIECPDCDPKYFHGPCCDKNPDCICDRGGDGAYALPHEPVPVGELDASCKVGTGTVGDYISGVNWGGFHVCTSDGTAGGPLLTGVELAEACLAVCLADPLCRSFEIGSPKIADAYRAATFSEGHALNCAIEYHKKTDLDVQSVRSTRAPVGSDAAREANCWTSYQMEGTCTTQPEWAPGKAAKCFDPSAAALGGGVHSRGCIGCTEGWFDGGGMYDPIQEPSYVARLYAIDVDTCDGWTVDGAPDIQASLLSRPYPPSPSPSPPPSPITTAAAAATTTTSNVESSSKDEAPIGAIAGAAAGAVALLLIVGLGVHFSRKKRAASGAAASAAKPSAEVQITAGAAESEKAADKI